MTENWEEIDWKRIMQAKADSLVEIIDDGKTTKKSVPFTNSGYCFLVVSIESEADFDLYFQLLKFVCKEFSLEPVSMLRNTVCFTSKEFWEEHREVGGMCCLFKGISFLFFPFSFWNGEDFYERFYIYTDEIVDYNNQHTYKLKNWYLVKDHLIYEFNPDLVCFYHQKFLCENVYINPIYC